MMRSKKMSDERKTREQLINDAAELRARLKEIERAYSDYKKTTERIRLFEQTLVTMQIGVTITDLEGNIIYINPAELLMHGYTLEELKDRNIEIFAPVKKRSPLTYEKISSMKKWKRESINKRKDGSLFPVQLMSDVIRDAEGNPVGIVTTCEDITERKKMENEIKDRVEDLEKFYEASIHREVKMKDLKSAIKKLEIALSDCQK